MRVTIRQRGGFVGGEVTLVQLDTGDLNPAARLDVEREIAALLAQPAPREAPVGADLLEYELELDDAGRRDAKSWIDDGGGAAAQMRDLIARLQQVRT